MDRRYSMYLEYSNKVPHLFEKGTGVHTVKLSNLFTLPVNGAYVKVNAQMDSNSPLIARVAHTGIRFIWETQGNDLNCDLLDGDTWEFVSRTEKVFTK